MQGHIVLKPNQNTGKTISTSAASLDTPETDTVAAIIAIETADVRMRHDGTAPVAGAGPGMLMKADSVWEISGRDNIAAMQFIAESDDAYITCTEYSGG
jgi:hypothetical protein